MEEQPEIPTLITFRAADERRCGGCGVPTTEIAEQCWCRMRSIVGVPSPPGRQLCACWGCPCRACVEKTIRRLAEAE